MKGLIYIVFGWFCTIAIAQNGTLFQEANALYNDGKFNEAIEIYETILDGKTHSAEVYFNLANAHYKLNNIAPTIYYYEKALLLKPKDKDILNNLGFAQNMTIDAIDNVPDVGFSRLIKNIVNLASADTWAKLAILGVFIFVVLFILYRFAYATARKRVAFVVSVIGLFLAFFGLVMAFQKDALEKKNNPAIVFAAESRVKSDPNKTSEELFRLHEGTKVQVIERYEDWFKIEIADKTTGWIPERDIKALEILPF